MNFLCIFRHKARRYVDKKTGLLLVKCQRCHDWLYVRRYMGIAGTYTEEECDELVRNLPLYQMEKQS